MINRLRRAIKARKVIPTDTFSSETKVHKEGTKDPIICHRCGGWGSLSCGHTGQPIECPACAGTGEFVE